MEKTKIFKMNNDESINTFNERVNIFLENHNVTSIKTAFTLLIFVKFEEQEEIETSCSTMELSENETAGSK
ncbi:MAG: hypothetical protein J6M02_05680 [Clostridia bacterium]|nr:hypothetical protein [Clostridia bacterium]